MEYQTGLAWWKNICSVGIKFPLDQVSSSFRSRLDRSFKDASPQCFKNYSQAPPGTCEDSTKVPYIRLILYPTKDANHNNPVMSCRTVIYVVDIMYLEMKLQNTGSPHEPLTLICVHMYKKTLVFTFPHLLMTWLKGIHISLLHFIVVPLFESICMFNV